MKLLDLHAQHRRHLASLRRSPATLDYYRYALEPLEKFLAERSLPGDTDSLSKPLLQEFQLWLRESRKMKPGGEHAVMRWAHEEELIPRDPTAKLKLITVPQARPPAVQLEEAREALRIAATMEQPLRNRALLLTLLTLLDTGVRAGELLQLRVEDVDLEWGMLQVRADRVHSGDLRSAPLPVGATEDIDLDLGALRRAGAARVLATVHAYTSVPFSRMGRASCGLMSRVDTGEGAREMDPSTVRLRFDLRGEQTSCILLAIDLGEPGQEQVVFLELAGDRGGYQVTERDRRADLAVHVGRAARGLPLTLLLAAHAVRAGRVVCGDTRLRRQEGEDREAFAERVHLALLDLVEGRAVRTDPGESPRGPTLRVADRAGEVLRPGDTLVSLGTGVVQPPGVRLLGLRGLLEGL